MRFIAIYNKGAIMTDEYTDSEIMKNLHIKHLMRDIELCNIRGKVRVYDEKNRFVCYLNYKVTA